jgi:hypothetical protein
MMIGRLILPPEIVRVYRLRGGRERACEWLEDIESALEVSDGEELRAQNDPNPATIESPGRQI